MSFTESREKFGEYISVVITDNETKNQITIIPEMGAILNDFKINREGEIIEIIDGHTTVEEMKSEYYSKSSLLAPFPNRIADGEYEFQGNKYSLPINKVDEHNTIHGFVSDKKFEVSSSGEVEGGYEVSLKYETEGIKGYPFPFKILVRYTFKQMSLHVSTTVVNTGLTDQPMGFGWHPYLKLGQNINEISLKLPIVEEIVVDRRLIPTGHKIIYKGFQILEKIGEAKFDTGFKFLEKNKEIVIADEKIGLNIHISCVDESYNYIQVFIPPWRTSIAIEPMTCAANAFNNKMGVKTLKPGKSMSAEYEIRVVFT